MGSDRRIKRDITACERGLDFVCKLKPARFQLKACDGFRLGFIAQQVQEIAKDFEGLAEEDTGDKLLSLEMNAFIAPLVKAIQELNDRLTALEKKTLSLKL